MPTTALVIIRAVHFASCLIILAVWAFDRFIAAPAMGPSETISLMCWNRIARHITWTMLPAALISGALWLALVAVNMSGLPLHQAILPPTLSVVLDNTTFGTAWKWRLALWIATAALSGLATARQWSQFLQAALAWSALLASGAFAASLV